MVAVAKQQPLAKKPVRPKAPVCLPNQVESKKKGIEAPSDVVDGGHLGGDGVAIHVGDGQQLRRHPKSDQLRARPPQEVVRNHHLQKGDSGDGKL